MNDLFTFSLLNDNADVDFEVFDFVGREGISEPFCFEITLSCPDGALDVDQAIGEAALFTLRQQRARTHEGTTEVLYRPIYGVVSEVQVGGRNEVDGEMLVFYRFRVVPRLWKLTLGRRSRVFRDKTVEEIIEQVLEDNDLEADLDFRMALSDSDEDSDVLYEEREYTVQYQESDFNFISRLMEHEGIFYFFEMDEAAEQDVLVITDSNPATEIDEVEYFLERGLRNDPAVHRITMRRTMAPAHVHVWDNDGEDFREPTYMAGQVGVNGTLGQQVYEEYGEWLQERRDPTTKQFGDNAGDRDRLEQRLEQVAQRRAEEIAANQAGTFRGRATDPRFWAGAVIEPEVWDAEGPAGPPTLPGDETHFLLTRIRHAGTQGESGTEFEEIDMLLDPYPADLQPMLADVTRTDEPAYINSFTCISSAMPFRAPRTTPVPRVPGILTAKIEQRSGKVVDNEGRYRLRMSFDQDEEDGAEGRSRPVRMAQPYSGPDYGIHFPNREDAEAVVAFIDGDINRPVMLSTVPTPKNHTPAPNEDRKLSAQNPSLDAIAFGEITFSQNKNVIYTSQGHRLVMDDEPGEDDGGLPHVDITLATKDEEHKIEMGGKRVKSGLEQVADGIGAGIEFAAGSTQSIIKREFPGVALKIVAAATTAIASGRVKNPADPTAGVGLSISSGDAVTISGHDGIEITSPNMLGIFGGGEVFGMELDQEVTDARSWMLTLTNLLISVLWNGMVMKVFKAYEKNKKDDEKRLKKGMTQAEWVLKDYGKYDIGKSMARVKEVGYSALQLAGIKLKSAGEIQIDSFMKLAVVAGSGGVNMDSNGDIVMGAHEDARVKANHKIELKTRGKPEEDDDLTKKLKDLLKIPAVKNTVGGWGDTLMSKISSRYDVDWAKVKEPPPKTFPITLENEHGGIHLVTKGKGVGDGDKGHIDLAAEKGDVRLRAPDGKIAFAQKKEFSLIVGDYDEDSIKKFYESSLFEKKNYDKGSKLLLDEKNTEFFSPESIRIQTAKDDPSDDNSPSVQIDKDSITLQCGESSVELKKDGTITIKGKAITVTGEGVDVDSGMKDITMKGNNIKSEAQMKIEKKAGQSKLELGPAGSKLEGTQVELNGQAKTDVKSNGILMAKGSLTKIG